VVRSGLEAVIGHSGRHGYRQGPSFDRSLKGSTTRITPPGDAHGSARRARPPVRQASESPFEPAVLWYRRVRPSAVPDLLPAGDPRPDRRRAGRRGGAGDAHGELSHQARGARAVTHKLGLDQGLRWIRRRPSSMNTRTSSVRSQAVSTVKKSQATMPSAWARRNSVQVGPERRGAGPSRAVRSRVRIVVALTRSPSFLSSPPIRTQPSAGTPGQDGG
jgi:hypothetical protein